MLWSWKNITSITDINLFIKTIDRVIKKQKTNFEIFNISDDKTKKYVWYLQRNCFKIQIKMNYKIIDFFY